MNELCRLIWCGLIGFFRSRASLEAEILVLRHQLNVLRRNSPKQLTFGNIDRLIFARLYGLAPNLLSALAIVRPETVIRWHRAGFRLYWRWKSKSPGGRPARGRVSDSFAYARRPMTHSEFAEGYNLIKDMTLTLNLILTLPTTFDAP